MLCVYVEKKENWVKFVSVGRVRPKFGQQNEDGASVPAETPDVIMTAVSYVWSRQVFPERPVNIIRYGQGNSPQSHNLPKQCDGTLC